MSPELKGLGIVILVALLSGIILGAAWDDDRPPVRREPTGPR